MGYLITFYFIVLDFFTGLLKAFATGTFSSKIMRQGLFHKVALLMVMLLGWLVDYAQRFVDLGVGVPVGGAVCVYIILMEVGSILENLCQANPELMPDKLCKLFGVELRKQMEGDPHENQ
jgi:toxin secretion/phage lysis holin